jgi:hypothetical protein
MDDHPTSWEVSPNLFGSIAPIETVLSSTDGWCRDYEEVIADDSRRYRLVGIACRKPGPRWLVLDVRPFVEQFARPSVDRAFDWVTQPGRYAASARLSPAPSHGQPSRGRVATTTSHRPPEGEPAPVVAEALPVEREPMPVVIDGLSGTAARALLGQPATRAGHAPGETWMYRSGSCEVDLFLFPDLNSGGLRVLDHRVSGAGSQQDGQQECLRRLRDGHST